MLNIKQLRNERSVAFNAMQALNKTATDASRRLTDAERAEFDGYQVSIASLDADIARAQALLDAERTAPAAEGTRHDASVGQDNREKEPFANIGDFLKSAQSAQKTHGREFDPRLRASQGQNETNPDEGGWTIPSTFSQTVFERTFNVDDGSDMASRCFQVPMSTASFTWPALRDDDRRDGKRFGGITGYWTAEGKPIGKAKAKTREQRLVVHKLAVIVPFTDELLEDGTAMQAIVDKAVPEEFKYILNSAIYSGDGAGKPAGAFTATTNPSLIVVPKTANQPANTITFQNLVDMWARMPAGLKKDAAWFVTEDMESILDGVLLNTVNLNPQFLPYQAANTPGNPGPYAKFKGAPIIPIEQAPGVGSQGDIALGAMSQYALGRRGGVRTDTSMHVYFETDETAFRWVIRVDGESMWDKPVTPANSQLKKSPFVVLAPRA